MDLIQALGVYATVSIEQIGSYAGFAAVLGLAVLAALYFSQARDVKRLREWAGRAPERDAEARARVAAATAAGQQRQAGATQPAAASAVGGAAAAQPAAAGADGGNSGGATATPAATPEKTPAVAASASKAPAVAGGGAAGAAAGAGPASSSGGGTRPAVPIRPAGSRPSGATSILGAKDEPREPWYRRIAPRYIALIVAGVLVVGGGIAVGAIQLLSSDDTSSGGGGGGAEQAEQTSATGEKPARTAIRPGDVSLAVLNATGVNGLANQFGDRAQSQGFKKDNVGNAPGGEQRAESVVLFAPGKEREAKFVRRKFDVNNIEPVDAESQALAPQADVILVIGADKTS